MALSIRGRRILEDIADGRARMTEEEKRREQYMPTDDAYVRAEVTAKNDVKNRGAYRPVNPFTVDVESLNEKRAKLQKDLEVANRDPQVQAREKQAISNIDYKLNMVKDPQKARNTLQQMIAGKQKDLENNTGMWQKRLLMRDIDEMNQQLTLLDGYILGQNLPEEKTNNVQRMMMATAGEDPDAPKKKSTMDEWLAAYPDAKELMTIESYLPEGKTLEDYAVQESWSKGRRDTNEAGRYLVMTDAERRAYDAMDEENKARFMDAMQMILNERTMNVRREGYEKLAENHPVLANVVGNATEVLKPVGSVYALVQGLRGEDIDPNSPFFNPNVYKQAVTETTKENIEANSETELGRVLKTGAYDVVMGLVDNAVRMLAYGGTGGKATTAMMGFNTIGDTAMDVAEKKGNNRQALGMGTLNGAIEVATEYLPMERLLGTLQDANRQGWGQALRNLGVGMLEEGAGEGLSEFFSILADKAVMGTKSDTNQKIQDYMVDGMSYEEAAKQVFKESLGQIGYSGAIGAITGGVMQGGAQLANTVGTIPHRRALKQLEQLAEERQQEVQRMQQEVQQQEEARMNQEAAESSLVEDMLAMPKEKTDTTVTTVKPEEMQEQKTKRTEEQEMVQRLQTETAKAKRRMAKVEAVKGDEGLRIRKDNADVDLSDLDSESADAQMLNAAQDMSADATNDMLSLYEENGEATAEQYAKGYQAAYAVGLSGESVDSAKGLYMDDLTDAQRKSAWLEGYKQRSQQETRIDSLTRRYANEAGLDARVQGRHNGVSLESVTRKLSSAETMQLQLIDQFAKKYNIDVRVFDTLKGGEANAYIKRGTNEVHIALDAQDGALTRVMSHELYHFVEQNAGEDAKAIRAYVLDKLRSKEGYDLDERIEEITERYRRAGVMDFDAESEIVADGMLDIIGTEENLREMAKNNKNLLQKIKDHIQALLDFVRDALRRASGHSEEVRALMDDADYMQEIVNRMNRALENAAKNYETKTRVTAIAKQNGLVQGYLQKVENAENAEARKAAADNLVQNLMYVTQESVLNATGDMEGTLEAFSDTLQRFVNGEGQLDSLLRKAGLNATTDELRPVVAYAAREMVKKGQEAVDYSYAGERAETAEIKPLSEEETLQIQNIGRKSVNEFTKDDVEKTARFARRYWKEMGIKSPFFRAWFGDWRANDKTPVRIANKADDSRGVQKNADTGWIIQVSGKVFSETNTHQGLTSYNARKYLPLINDIVNKAVLLDSYGMGKEKSVNSLLMHSLYAVADAGNGPEVVKLYVEEMNVPGKDGTAKRSYKLQTIEKTSGASARVQGKAPSSVTSTPDDIKSVADLFDVVKKNDKNFNPKEINGLLNDDGTPAVYYHGTPYGGFDTFKGWNYFTKDKEYADNYQNPGASSIRGRYDEASKPETYEVYLTAKKVFDTRKAAEKKIWREEFYDHYSRTPISDRGVPDWTDGIDLIEFFEENDYDYDAIILDEGGSGGYGEAVKDRGLSVVIKDSKQVKSVDNAGTFDENTGNIYYSLKSDNDTYFDEVTYDQDVRDAGRLVQHLLKSREKAGFKTGEWRGKTGNIAKKILEETGSAYAQNALTGRINKAFEAIDHADSQNAIMAYCYDIGKAVAANAGEVAEMDPGRQQARDYLRGTKIYLNAEMQSEVAATYGSVQAFMRRNFGKTKFTTDRKATGLEEMWSELHDLVPSVFKEDTQMGEMPMIVEAFLESSGKVNRVYYNATEEQIAQDVAMRLFWEYFQMPGTYTDLKKQEQEMVQKLSDTMDSLRDTFEQRVQERITQREEREEKVRQRTMLERTVKQMDRKLRKPTKQNHIPEQYRGAVAAALELVNTSGNRKGQETRTARYNALLGEIAKLRENDSAMAHIDPDMEAHIEELKNKAAGKSIMVMNAEELKTLNDIMRNIQHACVKSDQLLTAGRQTSLRKMASAFHENMATRGDRKVKGNLGTAFEKIGRSMQDAPRFFNELARVGGEGARELWEIIRFDGLDTQIRLVEEAEKKMHEALDGYDYKKMYSENSGNTDFATESGSINLTKGQVMALYLLNKREQARNHIYGVKGEDGGIAQGRVKVGVNKYSESVRPSKVNEMQVKAIIDTLTADEKAVADKMGALLSGWCADLGNEVSMQMYGYKKFTEANYFPIQVWDGRKSVTSGEQFKNDLYQIMNKGFTKELTDKAQAPLVVPDIFDAVTEHVNGMIVYRAWTAPVTDVIKFLNYKYTDETTETIDGVVQYVDGRNILGSVREDMDRVLGKAAADYMTQLLKDINGRSKNNVEKIWDKGVGVLTRNQKSSAVAANIGTMMKQPFSITRAFDVIPAYYFAGKPIVPTKKRAELIAKYAPIYYWKQQGNFTMDSGKSIQSILMPGLESTKNKFNELAMAGAGYMDNVTWHNIWAASERMVNAKIRSGKEREYAGLQEGTDAYYKKVAEIFDKCVDETQTVDSILHRTEVMRQDSALLKMLTSFMGEPLKTLNMMMDAVDGAKKKDVQSMRRLVRTGAVLGVSVVVQEMVNAMVSTLRNWDDEDKFWEQFKDAFLGEYEEDMTKGEKAKEFLLGSSLGSGLNILTYIPVARDLMETFSGYTVERMDMTLMSDLVKAVQQLDSESKGDVKKVTDILGALGNMFGIPAGNIIKESGRIWNYVAQQLEAAGVDTLAMQYAQLKVKKDLGESNLTDYATLILKAEKQGNTDLAKQIRADMLEAGATEKKLDKKLQTLQLADSTGLKASDVSYEKAYGAYAQAVMSGDKDLAKQLLNALQSGGDNARDDKDIEDGVAKYLAENDERVMKAAKQKLNNDLSYTDVYAKIRADGFSDAVAKKAVTKAYNAIKPEAKEDKAESKEKKNTYVGVYDSADFASVVETKNARDAQKVVEDLRKQGKNDSSIKSSITNYAKDLYKQLMNGTARDKQEAQKLKEMLLGLDLKNRYTEKAIEEWLK